jgi:VWFA-related protein
VSTAASRTVAVVALSIGVLAASHAAVPAQERSVFSSRVEAVRIDALVTDGRQAVKDLKAADFLVTDNGAPQQVELISFDEVPLNVVIALDESPSLTGERLAQLRAASGSLAAILKQDDRAALLTFSETVTLQAAPTQVLERVRAAIAAARADGSERPTALVDAVFASVLTAEAETGRALVVVFSDGVETGSWLRPDAVLEIARRSDAVVYAVATYHAGRGEFLADLTRATGGSVTEVEDGGDIGAAFLSVLNEFRQRYLISYTPRGVTADGWHAVQVRVKGRDLKVTARPGYWGGR